MATHGALKARRIAHNAAGVVGIELLAAAQGIDFHAPLATSPALSARPRGDPRAGAVPREGPLSRAGRRLGAKRRCWTAPFQAPSRQICSISSEPAPPARHQHRAEEGGDERPDDQSDDEVEQIWTTMTSTT